MKLTIIAFGTRGDVQPLLALAKGLKAHGHLVRMVSGIDFRDWIESHGIETASSNVDVQAIMLGQGGQEWVQRSNSQIRQTRVMKQLSDQFSLEAMRDAWMACEDADAVMSGFTSDVFAVSIAEKLGVPHISAPLQPALVATRYGASCASLPFPKRDSLLNFLFGKLFIEPYQWSLMGAANNRFRVQLLGLRPQTQRQNQRGLARMLVIQGFSPSVVPHAPDWPPNIHTVGYWFLDQRPGWEAPQSLLDFLSSGEPPVYIGFGSMPQRDPRELGALVAAAVRASGRRAVVQSGWAGIGASDLPKSVLLLEYAPHSWLFPRVCAVVHHGGAGTTAESLRAGIPMVIVPHITDQPFWGARVAALGAGPQPIPRHKLTVDRLARAIRQAAEDPVMARRARELSSKIRAEDGVGNAVSVIDGFLASRDRLRGNRS